jgi:ATP-binding cassette subfamily C protein
LRDGSQNPLLAACQSVGGALGLSITAPPTAAQHQRDPISAIARASRVRVRRVALRGSWWRGDNGPLVSFTEADKRPVALLPDSARRYQIYDATEATVRPLTAERAGALEPFGYTFFRSFPDRAITTLELLKFGLRNCRPDLVAVLLTGLAVGFLGLAPPIVTRIVFDSIIPAVNQFKLLQLTMALVVAAI